jgi:fumarate reductase (CoM/CoB) subunit B
MGCLAGTDTYWKFVGQCAECGMCTLACPSLTKADMTMGKLAKSLLTVSVSTNDVEDASIRILANDQVMQAVRGCFLCTTCQSACFADNDISELVYTARKDFQNLGLLPRSTWSSVLVDEEWDIFTAYRAVYGIGYNDLIRHLTTKEHAAYNDFEVAFFPGCSLAAYAPELTREVFATIEEIGGKTTMLDHCCGSPLRSAGFYDRAAALCDKIADEIVACGAKHVICACPGCRNTLEATLAARHINIPVINLANYLDAHDFNPVCDTPRSNVCVARSCQDLDGSYLRGISSLLELDDSATTVFKGCCGAGGAVNSFDAVQQASQVERKLDQVSDGQTLISACPTCTYTYAFHLASAPRAIENKNYLELIFENDFHWETIFQQLESMWSGEYGPWLAHVFA